MSLNKLSTSNNPSPYLRPMLGGLSLYNNNVNGYIPTELTYFEQYSDLNIHMVDEFGGAIAQAFHLNIQRIGDYIYLFMKCPTTFNVVNTCTYIEIMNGIIPVRFRPKEEYLISGLTDNGDPKLHIGKIQLFINGNIRIFLDYEKSKKWDNAKNNKFYGFNAIYRI
jgi:hypothetical protein